MCCLCAKDGRKWYSVMPASLVMARRSAVANVAIGFILFPLYVRGRAVLWYFFLGSAINFWEWQSRSSLDVGQYFFPFNVGYPPLSTWSMLMHRWSQCAGVPWGVFYFWYDTNLCYVRWASVVRAV